MSAAYILESVRRIESTVSDVKDEVMEVKLGLAKLQVHEEKINTLQKVVYGAVGVVLLAFMIQLIPRTNTNTSRQASASTTQIEQKEINTTLKDNEESGSLRNNNN